MSRKLGPDAFDRYVALGPDRSYTEIARHFGVSKRSVTRAAAKERWQERLRAAEDKARSDADIKSQIESKATERTKRIVHGLRNINLSLAIVHEIRKLVRSECEAFFIEWSHATHVTDESFQ